MPALVNLDSLLEVKAVLPTLAAKWAKIVRGSLVVSIKLLLLMPPVHANLFFFIQVNSSETLKTEAAVAPVIPVKPVYTPEVSAVDTLIELLRESFKVSNAYIAVISYGGYDCSLSSLRSSSTGTRCHWHRRHRPQIPHRRQEQIWHCRLGRVHSDDQRFV